MICDMVGFTGAQQQQSDSEIPNRNCSIAWSSVREPSDVFHLLETVYQAFDECAKRRRVFKVETVVRAIDK